MMRRFLALILAAAVLICALLLLSSNDPSPMDYGSAEGRLNNLWYLPCDAVDAGQVSQLLAMGEDLLVCQTGEQTVLELVSVKDGSTLAQTHVPTVGSGFVQLLEDGVAVTDARGGQAFLLDTELRLIQTISLLPGADLWLLSPDETAAFGMSRELGIFRLDLLTGETRELLPPVLMLSMSDPADSIAPITCIGDDLQVRYLMLDLSAGTLTDPEESAQPVRKADLKFLGNDRWLLRSGSALMLYDSRGKLISRCTPIGSLSDSSRYGFVWSEAWQGWFFLNYHEEACRLMFWDPSQPVTGPDLELQTETVPAGEILEQELYSRAAALSEQYCLDIRIADRCIRDYDSFTADILTDPDVISHALDVLEESLSKYPEGFFSQLRFGTIRTIRIELVENLKAKKGKDVGSGTSAFAQERDDYYLMVLNGTRIEEKIFFHELTHIIDRRLRLSSQLREDALFSEETWMTYNPDGFSYAESYQNMPESSSSFADSGFFVREYSCVSATEDRAMMMEKAMLGEQAVFDANPGLIPKLEYYCACIRDAFNTSGWPDVTLWEQLLP